MTWIATWQDREYDIDPGEFNGLELSLIKQRAGFSYRQLLTEAIPEMDSDAIRALFWTIDRRTDPDLKFSEYGGPPMSVFLASFHQFSALLEALGKAIPAPTSGTNGSPSSPSDSDGPEPSTTS